MNDCGAVDIHTLIAASETGAWGRRGIRSCSADTWVDVPVVQVSVGGASNSVHRQSLWTFQYALRQGAFSRVWWRCRVGLFSRSSNSSRS